MPCGPPWMTWTSGHLRFASKPGGSTTYICRRSPRAEHRRRGPVTAVAAPEAHVVGVEEGILGAAVGEEPAVGRPPRSRETRGRVRDEVPHRAARDRHDEEPAADAIERLVLEQ